MEEYSDAGIFLLMDTLMSKAMKKTKNIKEIEANMHFAEKSDVLKAWCVVENLNYKDVGDVITRRNRMNLINARS